MTMITNQPAAVLLNHAPLRVAIAASGAGAGLQKTLWDVPGISAVLVEASFPYAMEATDQFLRFKPDRYCSACTAVEMAMECYYRAFQYNGPRAIGVGLSASVASLKAHRGEHRVFAASFSDKGCRVYERVLEKTNEPATLARVLDGAVADAMGLLALLEAVGAAMDNAPEATDYDGAALAHEAFWARPVFTKTGQRVTEAEAEVEAIFPGAFNPPHHGHFGMAHNFQGYTRISPTFHVTAETPHKPPLSVAEMLQRAKMLEGHHRMFTRNDPLYVDKAAKFPGRPILVGSDALERLLDPKWGPTPEELGSTFEEHGTVFYVPETRVVNGREVKLEDLTLPKGLRVIRLPGRWDVSSSELRATSAA